MPCRPFTYDHKEYAINPNEHLDLIPDFARQPDEPADEPVTVADLLDAYDDRYRDLYLLADNATRISFNNLRSALAAHERHQEFIAELSPSERAEFDRRTT